MSEVKRQIPFRLTESEVNILDSVAKERGCKRIDLIRAYIKSLDDDTSEGICKDTCDIQEDTRDIPSDSCLMETLQAAVDALTSQLAAKDNQISEKDDQIASLTRALAAEQKQVNEAHVLHAADKKKELVLESSAEQGERVSRVWWKRLFG